jgi:hypothetical protein
MELGAGSLESGELVYWYIGILVYWYIGILVYLCVWVFGCLGVWVFRCVKVLSVTTFITIGTIAIFATTATL